MPILPRQTINGSQVVRSVSGPRTGETILITADGREWRQSSGLSNAMPVTGVVYGMVKRDS